MAMKINEIIKSKRRLFCVTLVLVTLSSCNLDNEMFIVEVSPPEIKENSFTFEIEYPEIINGEKHEILLYAISMYPPKREQPINFDSIEILDITIIENSKEDIQCRNTSKIENQKKQRKVKIEHNKSSKPSDLLINGKLYKPKAELDYNISSYANTKQIKRISQPIRLFTTKENLFNKTKQLWI